LLAPATREALLD